MTSSNGTIFRVTGPSWGESTGDRWFSLGKASGVELWCFLWSAPGQTVENTITTPMIWDAIAIIWRHCDVFGRNMAAVKENVSFFILATSWPWLDHHCVVIIRWTWKLIHMKYIARMSETIFMCSTCTRNFLCTCYVILMRFTWGSHEVQIIRNSYEFHMYFMRIVYEPRVNFISITRV